MKKVAETGGKAEALVMKRKVGEKGKVILSKEHGSAVWERRNEAEVDDEPVGRGKGRVSELLSDCDPVAETDWEGGK